jgi:trimeric autotransporter adhesin
VHGTGAVGSLRPDVTGASLYTHSSTGFLNPLAFAPPAAGQWGTAGRNSITGPAQFSLDASLGRTVRWGDRVNLDIRIDATNVLNHVTFPNWNTTVNSSQFGVPNRANSMRTIRPSLRVRF